MIMNRPNQTVSLALSRAAKAAGTMFALASLLCLAPAAHANLIVNGSFESVTVNNAQLGYNSTATGWSTSGYNFVFQSGSADTIGATGQYGNLKLWGPGDGSANGLPASSPDGGNYLAADGAFQVSPITQTLTNLTQGAKYTVSFWWAGAQQSGFTGATTDQWQVGFGAQTQSTAVVSLPSHGFSGWVQQVFTFTADGTSDVLSFLAIGTPSGVPPFALLDGVTVNAATPEPGTCLLMFSGLLAGAGVLRRKQRSQTKR